ncbi:family 4 glycosyl hydrolase [Lachnoclostridium sp. Marseille-P6806]|uniref:family 4 glycosyl hydrolase n=1 Tax=Lachnoclostridium sp. Marseille-P6806 TaxID=2364793 RepID=UPI00103069E9|nr:alpha-glucosidase/alpha-galactosidase [Lachnoclostridium sp. Marseille-P6806]
MQYEDQCVKDIRIAYIGGGSRGWAWTFMTDLAREAQLSGEVRLYDIDRGAAEANQIIGNRLMQRPEATGRWRFSVSDSLESALSGCDFVVISILPGRFDEMQSDVHLPERLSCWQSVGDTAGPGGIIRALRTIPMFVEIAQAIRRCSPDAWVINYTNPMSLCVKTLYYTFPEIRAFGCCHEVFGTQKVLQGILEKETGERAKDWHDIFVNVLGINHFTWFSSASFRGVDLFPVYRHYIDRRFEEGFELRDESWMNSSFHCAHRVKMDLFLRYGWIAAAGDRHLAEFMPGNEYLNDPETVRSWKFGLTGVDWRKNDLKERLARSQRLVSGEEELALSPTGEEGIRLIRALCGLERFLSNVNLPNTALQISNLPADAVVETNAVFELGHIRPVAAGALPESIRALILPHVENHERTLRAALTFDPELVTEAFLHDPNFSAKCRDREKTRALADDMIRNTLTYLPDEWKKTV